MGLSFATESVVAQTISGFIKPISSWMLNFGKMLPIIGILFVFKVEAAYGTEPWQFVSGEYVSFVLPDRPVYSVYGYRNILESRNIIVPPDSEFRPIPEARVKCPAVTTLFKKIFNKIIQENSLRGFVMSGPGIKLAIRCEIDRSKKFGQVESAMASGHNTVKLPARLVEFSQSEDEIATSIGHEIAHIILGHVETGWDLSELAARIGKNSQQFLKRRREIRTEHEPMADTYGAILVWNAKFNPYASPYGLFHSRIAQIGWSATAIEELFYFQGGHGTILKRRTRLHELLKSTNLPNEYVAVPSPDLMAAKREFMKLNPLP